MTLHRAWAFTAALAVGLAFPLYRVLVIAFSQIGLVRTLGVWGALVAVLVVVALPLAWVASRVGPSLSPNRAALLRGAFFGLAIANLVAIGLSIFYNHPRLAPLAAQLAAMAIVAALAARYLTAPAEARAVFDAMLNAAGRLATAVPVVAAPWIAYAAWRMPPRFAASPLPAIGSPVRKDAPARILLVSFDALRQRSVDLDRPQGMTPTFAAVARRSSVFTACRAASNATQQSVLTLLTGVRPHLIVPHLQNRSGFVRQGDVTGIAAHLAPAGYRSHYVTMIVSPAMFGVTEEFASGHWYTSFLPDNDLNTRSFVPVGELIGWVLRNVRPPDPSHTRSQRNAVFAVRESFDRARRLLAAPGERTFVWLHVGAPHEPYVDVPVRDLGGTLRPGSYRKIRGTQLASATPAELQRYEAIYEHFVRFVDAELGLFVKGLEADGTWDDTLVVVTSDHGEQFRVGQPAHGHAALTEDVVAVPLLIRTPHQRRPARSDTVVGTEDVLPTVLAQVFVSPPPFVGRSLVPGPPPASRTLYAWARFDHFAVQGAPDGAIAAYRDRFKYENDLGGGREALYDLARDPQATRDVRWLFPAVFESLRANVVRDGLIDRPGAVR